MKLINIVIKYVSKNTRKKIVVCWMDVPSSMCLFLFSVCTCAYNCINSYQLLFLFFPSLFFALRHFTFSSLCSSFSCTKKSRLKLQWWKKMPEAVRQRTRWMTDQNDVSKWKWTITLFIRQCINNRKKKP